MAQVVIRKLDDAVKQRLKARAKRNGRSLEAEARSILEHAVKGERPARSVPKRKGLGTRIAERFKGIGFTKEEKRRFDRAVETWRGNPRAIVEK